MLPRFSVPPVAVSEILPEFPTDGACSGSPPAAILRVETTASFSTRMLVALTLSPVGEVTLWMTTSPESSTANAAWNDSASGWTANASRPSPGWITSDVTPAWLKVYSAKVGAASSLRTLVRPLPASRNWMASSDPLVAIVIVRSEPVESSSTDSTPAKVRLLPSPTIRPKSGPVASYKALPPERSSTSRSWPAPPA